MPTIKKKTKKIVIKSKSSRLLSKKLSSPKFSLSEKSPSLSKSEPKIRISKKAVKKAIPLAIGATALAGLLYGGYKFNKGFKNQYVYNAPDTKDLKTGKIIKGYKVPDKKDSFGNVIDRRKDNKLDYLKELFKDINKRYIVKDENYIPLAPGRNELKNNNNKVLLKKTNKDGKEEIIRDKNGIAIYIDNPNIIIRKTPDGQEILKEPGEVNEKDILKPLRTKYKSLNDYVKEKTKSDRIKLQK